MWIRDYVRKHPTAIVRGYVPFSEIIDKLKNQYHAVDLPLSETPSMRMHHFNAVNLPSNEVLCLPVEKLNFKAIKIPITEKSEHYTTKDYRPIALPSDSRSDFIYLIYEEQVGYHYSNSNKLFLEVSLSRGIPQEDIDNGTENYTSYLFYLQCYLEHTDFDLSNLM